VKQLVLAESLKQMSEDYLAFIEYLSDYTEDGIELGDLDVCACPCHTQPGFMHIAPCCSKCPDCGRMIRNEVASRHKSWHRAMERSAGPAAHCE
jgi:hypothetical protein